MALSRGRRIVAVLGAIALALAIVTYALWRAIAPAPADSAPLDPAQAAKAQQFIALLDLDDIDAAYAMLAPATRDKLPATELRTIWVALPAKLGDRGPDGAPRGERLGESQFIAIALPFRAMTLDARVHFNAQGEINGFRLVPALFASAAPPPADAPYREIAVTVSRAAHVELPGTLTLPRGDGPFPAAVLVHGSGPHDRDETIGPNKPFVDLARGLAARGIAVLRYDKRTYVDAARFAGDYTVNDEVVDDAVSAVAMLRARDDIHASRVFVIGHSLGGMMAPRIAREMSAVAGIVLLAAPARPLDAVVEAQVRDFAALDGDVTREELEAIAAVTRARELLTKVTRGERVEGKLLLDLPATYWHDLAAYDALAVTAEIPQRVLILQGGRDLQVSPRDDFARWQARFRDDTRVTTQQFPTLNHLFMVATERPSLAEYQQPGHVDDAVIAAISDWLAGVPAMTSATPAR
jgi:uncharacterized protein